jgi:DNA repair exonuclease SbcCD ATPase subunit
MITTEPVFWTQIVSIVGFVGTLFLLYRLLVDQKEATIQLQMENIAYLKDQITDLKAQSPDTLAQSLADRIGMFEAELKRLNQDKTSSQADITAKESELGQARLQAEDLKKKLLHARDLLKDYSCPYCGAALAEKAYQSESVEYQGRELDIDHEFTVFECGYQVVDGEVTRQCKTVNTGPVS